MMDALERYMSQYTTPQDELLEELERQTHLRTIHPQMLSGHVQGQLLRMLTCMIRPRRVLEIGTFTGYSALCMAAGLGDGATLDTIEADDELEGIATEFFARSPHGGRITMHIGSALEVAPRLGGRFDMVFIDGDKREYPAYLSMLLDGGLVGGGSWILADNILWYGKVADPAATTDPQTAGVLEFNAAVSADERLENVIIPMRDGINLIRVK